MEEALHRSFGYVIAFLLPGLVAIYALLPFGPGLPVIAPATCGTELSLTAWIMLLVGSLGVGLIVSALRWLLIDTLHHATGLSAPPLDFGRLHDQLEMFLVAVEHNYRFYQFHANLGVSLLVVTAAHVLQPPSSWSWHVYLGLGLLELLLLIASRDCLRRYYTRLGQLVKSPATVDPGTGR